MESTSTSVRVGTESSGPRGPATLLDTQPPSHALSASPSAWLPPACEPSVAPPITDTASTVPIFALRDQMHALQHSMDHWMPSTQEAAEDPFTTCVMTSYEEEPPMEQSYPIDDMLVSLSMISATLLKILSMVRICLDSLYQQWEQRLGIKKVQRTLNLRRLLFGHW